MPVYRVVCIVAIVGMVKDQAVLDKLSKTCLDSRERCFAEVDRTKSVQC
jgi:hypothetical protein